MLAENGSIAALNTGRENGIHGTVQESFGYLPDGKLSHAISNGMRYEYAYVRDGLNQPHRAELN